VSCCWKCVKDLDSRCEKGEVSLSKCVIRFLVSDKSREGSSPYGRSLSILANEGVCLRPQQNDTNFTLRALLLLAVEVFSASDNEETKEKLETIRAIALNPLPPLLPPSTSRAAKKSASKELNAPIRYGVGYFLAICWSIALQICIRANLPNVGSRLLCFFNGARNLRVKD